MAQRRVAAAGFGGAQPGVSILEGLAKGKVNREERESELQRRAILNRLATAQIERQKQATRFAAEDQEFERDKRNRLQTALEQSAQFAKDWALESGIFDDPSEAEDFGITALKQITPIMETESQLATDEAQRGSAFARTRLNNLRSDEVSALQEAQTLITDPTFLDLATDPSFEEDRGPFVVKKGPGTRMRAMQEYAQKQGIDPNSLAFSKAADFARTFRERRQSPLGDAGSRGQLSPAAQAEVSNAGGDVRQALNDLEADIAASEDVSSEAQLQKARQVARELRNHLQRQSRGGSSDVRAIMREEFERSAAEMGLSTEGE